MNKPFILMQGDNLVFTHEGTTVTVNRVTNGSFDEIVEAINTEDYDKVIELSNPARALESFYSTSGDTNLEIFGNSVTLNGKKLHRSLEGRLLEMYNARLPLTALVNFLERVQANPSSTSRQELYLFLEGNELPLTLNGKFMSYKSVKAWTPESDITHDEAGREFADGDYMSIGTDRETCLPTRLRVGDEIRVDRGEVDDRRENTCSYGYHFASLEYASTWTSWDAVLLMELDPADVVSIPNDYGNQKGRTCAYTVGPVHAVNDRTENDSYWHTPDVDEAFDGPVYDPDFDANEGDRGEQFTMDLGREMNETFETEVEDPSVIGGRWKLFSKSNTLVAEYKSRTKAIDAMRFLNDGSYVYDPDYNRCWRS